MDDVDVWSSQLFDCEHPGLLKGRDTRESAMDWLIMYSLSRFGRGRLKSIVMRVGSEKRRRRGSVIKTSMVGMLTIANAMV